jgi:hypothetical protein
MQIQYEEHSGPGYELAYDDPRRDEQVSIRVLMPSMEDPPFTPSLIEVRVGTNPATYLVRPQSLGQRTQLTREAIRIFDNELAERQALRAPQFAASIDRD